MNKKTVIICTCALAVLAIAAFLIFGGSQGSEAPVTNTPENSQSDISNESAAENNSNSDEKAAEEAAKSQTPESTVAPIPEENVTLGVVDGEEAGGDIDDETEQLPQQPAQPTVTAPPASSEPLNIDIRTLDYEGYHALSGEHQQQVINMFGTTDEFMRWYKDVEAEYKAANPGIEIGADGSVNLG